MRIKNLAAKVIGIGGVDLMPGSDWVEVDDALVYVPVFDRTGKMTGEKEILPSLRILEKMNQIVFVETKKEEPKKDRPIVVLDQEIEEAPVEEKKPRQTRKKKTT